MDVNTKTFARVKTTRTLANVGRRRVPWVSVGIYARQDPFIQVEIFSFRGFDTGNNDIRHVFVESHNLYLFGIIHSTWTRTQRRSRDFGSFSSKHIGPIDLSLQL